MKIYIVLPAYNEANRINEVLHNLKKANLPIIIIDDGSKDNTFEVAKISGFLTLRHKVNLGKGMALKTGCEAAFRLGADAVILMDSDGQHAPDDLSKFVKQIRSEQYDVVFGVRRFGKNVPLIRFFGNKLASFLISVMYGIYLTDLLCGFRALTKKGFLAIDWQSTGYGVETEMVIKTGLKKLEYCEIPVKNIYYDKFKGVTMLDAFEIFFDVIKWRLSK